MGTCPGLIMKILQRMARGCVSGTMLIVLCCGYGLHASAQEDIAQLMHAEGPVNEGGKRVLWLTGKISGSVTDKDDRTLYPGSSAAVAAALSRKDYDEVWLNSGGGSVNEGYLIAELLHRDKATVRVPDRDNVVCASSCTNMMLGAYNRIIEPGADFIIHASSGLNGMKVDDVDDESTTVIDIYCDSSIGRTYCDSLSQQLRPYPECSESGDLYKAAHPCVFYVYTNAVSVKLSQLRPSDSDVLILKTLAEAFQIQEIPRMLEMIRFYQLALNDLSNADIEQYKRDTLRGAILFPTVQRLMQYLSHYDTLEATMVLPPVYDSPGQAGWRSLVEDRLAIEAAGILAWQEIFTQIELRVQSELVRIIKPQASQLGPGGISALRILEATITCRIQDACYLDQHQARSLGYHNFDE